MPQSSGWFNSIIGRGEPIPPHATLIFDVQMIAFESTAQLSQRSAAPIAERFAFAAAKKAAANEAFQAGFFPKAMVLYAQVRRLL